MTKVADPTFVDTNVLIHSRSKRSPLYPVAVRRLDELEFVGVELWSSRQILREYLSAMTRPGTVVPPVPVSDLVKDVQGFAVRFRLAEDGHVVTNHLVSLITTIPSCGNQIHDANIVASMLAHGIPNLLTHNTADFVRYTGLITVLPLI